MKAILIVIKWKCSIGGSVVNLIGCGLGWLPILVCFDGVAFFNMLYFENHPT